MSDDIVNPTPEQLQAAIERTGKMWDGDWGIYLKGTAERCGITLDQAILFDMAITWREVLTTQGKNIAWLKKHVEDEHGPEPWQDL